MKVFVAGASGTIGVPLVRALVASGHQVFAMTRSPEKQQSLRALGATPLVADALDASALTQALINARPEVVIHQLTNLPKTGVRSAKDLESTNRLRIEGTRNLIDAAVAAALVALDHGVPGTIYDIVDDQPVSMTDIVRELATRAKAPRPLTVPSWIPRLLSPYMARVTSVRLPVSNAKARAELGWRPLYPTMRDGLARTMTNAA